MKAFPVATLTCWGVALGLWLIAAILLLPYRGQIGANIGAGLFMLLGALTTVIAICVTVIHLVWWLTTRNKK